MKKTIVPLLSALLILFHGCSKDSEPADKVEPDTIAPEAGFSITGFDTSTTEPLLLKGQIEINVNATDQGGIGKVEAFIDDTKVGEDVSSPYKIVVDLNSFLSSTDKSSDDFSGVLKIVVSDKAGNQTIVLKNIVITTPTALIKLTIPEGYLRPFFKTVYVFASDMDGNLLESTTTPILPTTRTLTLYAPENFDSEKEFMLTFMTFNQSSLTSSFATTYQNLTLENPKEIELKVPERFTTVNNQIFETTGFPEHLQFNGDGTDYRTSLYSRTQEWLFSELRPDTSPERTSNKIHLSYHSIGDFTDYYYLFLDRPLPEDFQLNINDFENVNSVTKSILFTNFQHRPEIQTSVSIFGYENEGDVQNDIYHTLWALRTGNFAFPMQYNYNNSFYQYRHQLRMEHFYSEGIGLPKDEYTIPSWTLDPVIQNNSVVLNKTGQGHTVGRLNFMKGNESFIYDWRILFDSDKTDEIVVPKLPEPFQNSPLANDISSGNLNIRQLEISNFSNITTYGDYITKTVKEQKDIYEVSDGRETIFISNPSVYIQFKDLFFD